MGERPDLHVESASPIGPVNQPLGPRIPKNLERVVRGFDREW
jgi:hypothetical protein